MAKNNKPRKRKIELLGKDNPICFYCGQSFVLTDLVIPTDGSPYSKKAKEMAKPTIEHLLARSIGGTHRKSNCVLAHKLCNNIVDVMPVSEKIKLKGISEKPDFIKEAIKSVERRIVAIRAAQ